MEIRSGVERGVATDVGCQRENNEDNYSCWIPPSDEQFREKGILAMVADGMGGYEGGQDASRIAIEVIQDVYTSTPDSDPRSLLVAGFEAAHRNILEAAQRQPALHGMGTTCTAVAVLPGRVYLAHIGDSRLYLVRGENISRLTHDHSYVGRLVESGIINADEAESHPQRHILTAALGAGDVTIEAPEEPYPLAKGDVLILCTDGLWSLVREDEIKAAAKKEDIQRACDELIQLARKRGGPDNITVQLLRASNGTG
jgi:serine/threonine protein phosphatase PrpC